MKISVIIPCYNMERFVRRAVESCTLSSPSHEVEIVCVDDCSTDETPKVLEEIASAAPNVKVVRHDVNKKLLEARRSGLAAATGDYIMHLDADDRFAPGTLDAVVVRLGEDPVDCLFFGFNFVDGHVGFGLVHLFQRFLVEFFHGVSSCRGSRKTCRSVLSGQQHSL